VHRGNWECVAGCKRTFDAKEHLRGHLALGHREVVNDTRVDDIVGLCYRPAPDRSGAQCRLCLVTCASLSQLRQHLGKHQEQVSLFALPSRLLDVDEGDEGDSDSGKKMSPENATIHDLLPGRHLLCAECGLETAGSTVQQLEVLQQHMVENHAAAGGSESIVNFSGVRLSEVFPVMGQPEGHESDHMPLPAGRSEIMIPRHLNTWNNLKEYLAGRWNVAPMADARSLSTTNPNDMDGPGFPNMPDRHPAYVDDSVREAVSYTPLDWGLNSDAKLPTEAEIERLVDAHGGIAFLDEHGLWAKLGYDLDIGRELTEFVNTGESQPR